MPRAYCPDCKKNVNATPNGSSIMGGIDIHNALPGGTDIFLPIQNHFQQHYCSHCGARVVTEEQIEKMEVVKKQANIPWPIFILMALGAFGATWYGTGDAGGFIVGLLF